MLISIPRWGHLIVLIFLAVNLSACATATRGSTTMFIVETTPVGAKATTTLPTKEFGEMTKVRLNRIKSGRLEEPDFEYRFCEPTPCGIEMPRKKNFHVLVTKEGYAPQVHKIGYMHRKEIKNESLKNTALVAGGAGIATGIAVGTTATSSLLFSGGAAAGTAAGIVVAVPIVVVGGVSIGVDAATGANYDVWPNPLPLTLDEIENADPEWQDVDAVKADFAKMQHRNAMHVPLTKRESKAEQRQLLLEERQRERERKRLEKENAKQAETPS
ncbi:MAG: hypothetical protein EX271_07125 [Acidimicrobiales bacterium]|nr:hypothetical protein [Hyphomonadaceae bacterium]RZV41870.1 MAG: hypothetical protein EX271_07125 [Acidimicrobiales bacterium]